MGPEMGLEVGRRPSGCPATRPRHARALTGHGRHKFGRFSSWPERVSPSRGHGVARRAEVPSSQPGLRAHRAVVPCIGHALTRAGRSITEKPGLQALVMATDASRETSLTDVVVTEL